MEEGNNVFTDTWGNQYRRIQSKVLDHKYRIVYKKTNHTFVGQIAANLRPLKGTYFTKDRQIEGLWQVENNDEDGHEPIPNPSNVYKMTFTRNGEYFTYKGGINALYLMNGAGHLHFQLRRADFEGEWWDDRPSHKQFLHRRFGVPAYVGQIDEVYDYHGSGKVFLEVNEHPQHYKSIEAVFYRGKLVDHHEARITYYNGNIFHGTVDCHGRPDGAGKVYVSKDNKTYSGIWDHGVNDYVQYELSTNIVYRSRLDNEHNEVCEGSYQVIPSGAIFSGKSIPQKEGLRLLAEMSTEAR